MLMLAYGIMLTSFQSCDFNKDINFSNDILVKTTHIQGIISDKDLNDGKYYLFIQNTRVTEKIEVTMEEYNSYKLKDPILLFIKEYRNPRDTSKIDINPVIVVP